MNRPLLLSTLWMLLLPPATALLWQEWGIWASLLPLLLLSVFGALLLRASPLAVALDMLLATLFGVAASLLLLGAGLEVWTVLPVWCLSLLLGWRLLLGGSLSEAEAWVGAKTGNH